MKKQFIFGILRALVSIILLAFLFWLFRKKLSDVSETLAGTNLRIFALAILTMVLCYFLTGLRLKVIFAGQKVKLSVSEANYLCYVGQFFNNFLPTSVGGDIVKAYYAAKKSPTKVIAYASVFVDRLSGVASLIFLASLAAVITGSIFKSKLIMYVLGSLIIGTILFFIFLWHKKVAKKFKFVLGLFKIVKLDAKIKKFYDTLQGFKDAKPALLKGFVLSIILQLVSFYASYLLALSIGAPAKFIDFIAFMPIVGVVAMLPSLNGLGVREGAFVYFFKQSLGAEAALAVSILTLLQGFILSAIGGILYFLGQFRLKD